MTLEPLRVDPPILQGLGKELLDAAQRIPDPPPPLTVEGEDAISQAIKAAMPALEDPIRTGLPKVKADATKTAQNIVAAAQRYQETDEQLAKAYEQQHLAWQTARGGAGGGATPARTAIADAAPAGAAPAAASAGGALGASGAAPAAASAAGSGPSAGSVAGSAAGSAGGGMSQVMGMATQMASQVAQMPSQLAGMVSSIPQTVMQTVQQAASTSSAEGDPGEHVGEAERVAADAKVDRDEVGAVDGREQPEAGAHAAGAERAPLRDGVSGGPGRMGPGTDARVV